ncbi:hypothetical protein AN958_07719 [Leucoagaricus sp. SymC.cos]|nr:hypothetical protein AN958_07719 [Leucoagaricus sp. SymC.cos]
MECKANVRVHNPELFPHHVENYALLQRETNQWKDQAKNWQEHFLRVEQERCSLSSRVVSTSKPHPSSCSTNGTSMPRPPTYQSAVPSSTNREAGSSQSPLVRQNSRSANGRTTKRKVPSKSELPPYSEVIQTPQTNKTSAFKSTTRSNGKPAAASSRAKRTAPAPPAAATAEPPKQPQQPQQIFIRRVHAVVEVKQEEESDEDLSEPPPPESPEESLPTPRRSRNSRRARQIVEDDDEYVPDDAFPELGSNEDAEDDELMIGAGVCFTPTPVFIT